MQVEIHTPLVTCIYNNINIHPPWIHLDIHLNPVNPHDPTFHLLRINQHPLEMDLHPTELILQLPPPMNPMEHSINMDFHPLKKDLHSRLDVITLLLDLIRCYLIVHIGTPLELDLHPLILNPPSKELRLFLVNMDVNMIFHYLEFDPQRTRVHENLMTFLNVDICHACAVWWL